jgi:hypothetical protein
MFLYFPLLGWTTFLKASPNFFKSALRSTSRSFSSSNLCFSLIGFGVFLVTLEFYAADWRAASYRTS